MPPSGPESSPRQRRWRWQIRHQESHQSLIFLKPVSTMAVDRCGENPRLSVPGAIADDDWQYAVSAQYIFRLWDPVAPGGSFGNESAPGRSPGRDRNRPGILERKWQARDYIFSKPLRCRQRAVDHEDFQNPFDARI